MAICIANTPIAKINISSLLLSYIKQTRLA